MNWNILNTLQQMDTLLENSYMYPQVIFKHSTRCAVSSIAKTRLEKSEAPGHVQFHFLDLIAYRFLSDKIAELLNVHHESPQVLLIKNGDCIYDESHLSIYMDEITKQAA